LKIYAALSLIIPFVLITFYPAFGISVGSNKIEEKVSFKGYVCGRSDNKLQKNVAVP
jgi:hypothetical protein